MHQLADGQALRMWRDESCDAMLYLMSVCGVTCVVTVVSVLCSPMKMIYL